MSKVVKQSACPECGSSDAYTYYDNGSTYCFSAGCGYSTQSKQSLDEYHGNSNYEQEEDSYMIFYEDLPIVPLKERGISLDTAKHFGVRTEYDEDTGEPVAYYYPHYQDDVLKSWKKRRLPKDFSWTASSKDVDLFGQNLVGESGKMIIVTEGQDDCMAGYEMLQELGKNYKIVSVVNGAQSIKKHIEFLSRFESIILCFDMDEPGVKAARKASELFKPGQAKVTTLPTKDLNDMLRDSKYSAQDFLTCINRSKTLTPVGIVDMSDSWDTLFENDDVESILYPWDGLNRKLYGLRLKELVTLTAGSGLGKSAVTREIEHWLLGTTEDNIGVLALEEDVARTGWGIMSIEADMPLHIKEERKDIPKEQLREWFNNTLGTGRIFTLDHFGSTESSTLLNKIRYLVNGLDCKWIVLDHLSIVVSGMDDVGDSERLIIDHLMTALRSLVQETGCGMILVSHLRRTGGDKGHEKGEEVSLSHLRGSQSIAQLSDTVIALERNQQDKDERKANTTAVRVLKNRYAGLTGIACYLEYDRDTGRLAEVDVSEGDEDFQY